MRIALLPVLLLLACAGSSDGSSREPSSHTTYPPKMIEGETVDANGKPLDSEIRQCLEKTQAVDSAISNAISGEKSSVDTTESDFQTCWCKSKGYRGLRMNGSCLE
ncbi:MULTISPECIES: hypothetical protein [Nannocystis]|uniref:Secreted protein n=1 Tax=Nannocystis radixulma TaxID=2995305 RepID=A0ABT5BEU5_9BACT|nr:MULTISPECIES: hypothetical protein [Nannocystis]MCY1059675.1 hypothetical protein [Nannocystis sp. SCPEA4]MDC0672665.1 hypothetical protein [Nannocystis radixulma]